MLVIVGVSGAGEMVIADAWLLVLVLA